jgi:hypothetical protein
MFAAIERGDAKAVSGFLANGVSPNLRLMADQSQMARGNRIPKYAVREATALAWAARFGEEEIVRMLLKAGADVDARSPSGDGFSAAMLAAQSGDIETLEALQAAGADLAAVAELPAIGAVDAVVLASHTDNVASIRWLIENGAPGARVFRTPPRGGYGLERVPTTLVSAACSAGEVGVRVLVEAGNDPGYRDADASPLNEAVSWGNLPAIRTLLDYGVGVDFATLDEAAWAGETTALALLLRAGADVDARGPASGHTALITAATFGQVEAVRLLLQAGASVDVEDNNGLSAVDAASVNEQWETIRLLLEAGATEFDRGRVRRKAAASYYEEKEVILHLIDSVKNSAAVVHSEPDRG